MVPFGLSDEEIKKLALGDGRTAEWTSGKSIRKVIVVRGRLVNIVVG